MGPACGHGCTSPRCRRMDVARDLAPSMFRSACAIEDAHRGRSSAARLASLYVSCHHPARLPTVGGPSGIAPERGGYHQHHHHHHHGQERSDDQQQQVVTPTIELGTQTMTPKL